MGQILEKSTKNILIIGDGIAAWTLIAELYPKYENITQIADDMAYPACSLRTTSINCLRGTEPGVSPLGDLIVSSYHLFEEFNQRYNPTGISKGIEYQVFNNLSKWEKRYPDYQHVENDLFLKELISGHQYFYPNEAYFIDPQSLKNWFMHAFPNIKKQNGNVKKIIARETGFDIHISDKVQSYDQVYVCAAKDSKKLLTGMNESVDYYLDHSKPVAGSYVEIDLGACDFKFDHDFNIVLEKYHFIYRKTQGILQIGSTSINKSESLEPDMVKLGEIYSYLEEHLKLDLPELSLMKVKTGIRHKGYKRLPFWGEVAPNLFAIFGLYKNAFTFAFQAAKEINTKKY